MASDEIVPGSSQEENAQRTPDDGAGSQPEDAETNLSALVDKFSTEEGDHAEQTIPLKPTPVGKPDEVDDGEEEESPTQETDEQEAPPKPKKEESSSEEETQEEEVEDPTPEELESYTPNSQKRIRQLVSQRKAVEKKLEEARKELVEAKAAADYKTQIDTVLEKTGIAPASFDNWIRLGIKVQTSPEEAGDILYAMAVNMGYKPPEGNQTPQAPADTIDEDLQQMVDSYQMTEEAAKKIQSDRNKKSAPQDKPKPQNGIPAQEIQPGIDIPTAGEVTPEQGDAAIKRVDAEYRAKYPDDWDKIVPEVMKKMKKYEGSPPKLWERIARDCAEAVVKARVKKIDSQPDPVVTSRRKARKQEPDRTTREGLADAIISGELFNR